MKSKRMLALLMTVMLFATMAITVSAESVYAVNDGYSPLSYSTTQSDVQLVSNLSVKYNNDSAILRIKHQCGRVDGLAVYPLMSGESSRGAKTFSYFHIMGLYQGYYPDIAYITYEVYGGTVYDAVVRYDTMCIDVG